MIETLIAEVSATADKKNNEVLRRVLNYKKQKCYFPHKFQKLKNILHLLDTRDEDHRYPIPFSEIGVLYEEKFKLIEELEGIDCHCEGCTKWLNDKGNDVWQWVRHPTLP